MEIQSDPFKVQAQAKQWKAQGAKVGLVPTMGCLHEGHLSLVRQAKELSDKVIASIFVNPIQFGPNEDLDKYPRTFDSDCENLTKLGVDLLFYPNVSDVFPQGFQSSVSVKELSKYLCGSSRPGHFDGVATICLKLFQTSLADIAVFGEKDFQQLRVLQQMVCDLNLPVQLIAHPIYREKDGLAMSSRNRYLSTDDREKAPLIFRSLKEAQHTARNRAMPIFEIVASVTKTLQAASFVIDYVQVVSESNLKPLPAQTTIADIDRPRLLVAAKLGSTRLIDNMSLLEETH